MSRVKGPFSSRLRLLRGPADDGAAAAPDMSAGSVPDPQETWERPGTTVLVVDANATTRAALVHLFRSEWSWHVVGQAADGLSALAAAREHGPELVVNDAGLSDIPLRDLAQLLAQAGNPVVLA